MIAPGLWRPTRKPIAARAVPKIKRGSGSEPPPIDPVIEGLLKRLPKTGDVWPVDRKLWLQLLEASFKLIYKDVSPPHHPREGRPQAKDESGLLSAASKLAWREEDQK